MITTDQAEKNNEYVITVWRMETSGKDKTFSFQKYYLVTLKELYIENHKNKKQVFYKSAFRPKMQWNRNN